MKEFLLNNYSAITKSVELIAALSGTIYLRKTKNYPLKIFVQYLWLTVIVEWVGSYSMLLLNNYDYQWYINLKNSVFCENRWLYNIYSLLTIGLLGIFYSDLLKTKSLKLIIRVVVVFYTLFSTCFYIFTDAFFIKGLPYDNILASIIVCLFVVFYFVELMKSEFILIYYKLPSFYISVALLLWYLCVTPLFIFDAYFYDMNRDFIEFRAVLLLLINIFTYLCFAFGFWYSLKKSKQ
ncbi:hypothetical protein [Psychroserpens luteolus]|uniref:hypothetical protein n=1 Tax=Psychroserpens luteolus TaxID=2855840 RepID=UPI001E4E9EC0|nr:hypothetical protein [Psychroserpens luteolus]MCD2259111.1 hypothetical protein [Psychroserpens luteolus]